MNNLDKKIGDTIESGVRCKYCLQVIARRTGTVTSVKPVDPDYPNQGDTLIVETDSAPTPIEIDQNCATSPTGRHQALSVIL